MNVEENVIKVHVTFRHTEPTEALKKYAMEKLTHCVAKYVADNIEVHVVLSVEKRDHMAEVNLHTKVFNVSAKAVTGDLYSSIDKVVDTVETQIRKQKERHVDHRHQAAEPIT